MEEKEGSGKNMNENEFVEADASEGWRVRLTGMFPALEQELHLTEHSLPVMTGSLRMLCVFMSRILWKIKGTEAEIRFLSGSGKEF